jgi:hypothetical protein
VTVRVGEVGKALVVNTDFDLSGSTELRTVLTKPDGTIITKLTADGVSAPSVNLTIDVDGVSTTLLADRYVQYLTEAGVMTPAGTWKIHVEYADATPKDFCGDTTIFQVLPCD